MEADKHYFLEGLFIIFFALAAAGAFVWLAKTGHGDDVIYRIHVAESVSGLAIGDPVKFHGVDVGTVKTMAIDKADPSLVEVDVSLRKDAPVKIDTKATLKMKGITGVMFVELNGGGADSKALSETTAQGTIPEIAYEKSALTSLLDTLPKALESLAAIGGQTKKMLKEVGEVTGSLKDTAKNMNDTSNQVKEDPSVLIWGAKKK